MNNKSPLTLRLCLYAAWCFLFFGGVEAHARIEVSATSPKGLIFPLQSQHVHGSSLVELPNGDFLAAWFQGSGERMADDVRIMGARLSRGEMAWSEPFELADTPNLPDCNPVLFMVGDQLFLTWIAVQANRWEHSILRVRMTRRHAEEGCPEWDWQDNILLKPGSEFAGEVADKLRELPDTHAGWAEYAPPYDRMIGEASEDMVKRSMGWMTRIKPLILSNGEILLPLYSDGLNMSLVARSSDGGRSWTPGLPIVGRGPIQPTLLPRKDGSLIALMRDSGDSPTRLQQSESHDSGYSWTVAEKTALPSGASVDGVVLPDGRWAIIYNDVDDGRYQLSVYTSVDEGQSWQATLALESDPNKVGRFSYPAMVLGRDAQLHITYSYHLNREQKSIRYMTLNPADL